MKRRKDSSAVKTVKREIRGNHKAGVFSSKRTIGERFIVIATQIGLF